MNDIDDDQRAPPSTERNPYTLWFVVLAFVAPVALAYYAFYFMHITNFTNHGQILKPMIQVSALSLNDQSDTPVPVKKLQGRWRFISFVGSSCDLNCQKRLIQIRQVRKSLGKEEDRTLLMLIELSPPDKSLAKFIKKELSDAVELKGKTAVISGLLPKGASLISNDVYLQDPIGNIMMRFTPDKSMKDIRSDINTLLKVSQIG